MDIEDQIAKLQNSYKNSGEKDKLYQELLGEYKKAKERIKQLEDELNQKNKLPSKEEVETISSMLDLVNKLDDSTIEKLSKFGGKK